MTTSDPRGDIGPFFKGLATILLIGDIGILLIQASNKHQFGLSDAVIQFIVLMLFVLLLRPDNFGEMIKDIAAKLPFVKYGRD